jgi:hypothetical protein
MGKAQAGHSDKSRSVGRRMDGSDQALLLCRMFMERRDGFIQRD